MAVAKLLLAVTSCLCLHVSSELQVYEAEREVQSIFQDRIYNRYHMENVINVSSWSVSQFPAKHVCSYILQVKPKIMGLQGVKQSKVREISKCLGKDYRFFLGASDGSRYELYNPIFFRNNKFVKPIYQKSGTFWLSDTPRKSGSSLRDRNGRLTEPRICSWIKINFAQKQTVHRNPSRGNTFKILDLLKVFTGKRKQQRERSSRRRRPQRYIWTSVYVVNTQLETKDKYVAIQQMALLKKHMKGDKSVMDRRQYPVIFMADLGWNHESDVYEAVESDGWLIDSMKFSARKFPLRMKNRNFIMRFRLKALMGASMFNRRWPYIMRNSQDHPVFAAYLSERSPVKKDASERGRNIVTARD